MYVSNYPYSSYGLIVGQTLLINLDVANSLREGKLLIQTCYNPLKTLTLVHILLVAEALVNTYIWVLSWSGVEIEKGWGWFFSPHPNASFRLSTSFSAFKCAPKWASVLFLLVITLQFVWTAFRISSRCEKIKTAWWEPGKVNGDIWFP